MGKAPADQFYWQDWARDLEEHPLEVEGAWIRLCCKLWFSDTRGELERTLDQWARILRIDTPRSAELIGYIGAEGIGDVMVSGERISRRNLHVLTEPNARITVVSRRMLREEKTRESNRMRQKRHYARRKHNTEPNADLTFPSSSSSSSKQPSSEGCSSDCANPPDPTPTKIPPCPQKEIVATYNRICVPAGCPEIREWDHTAITWLRSRWREKPERQSMSWWENFLHEEIATSDFLTGKKGDWTADLRWIVKSANFAKILNGAYRNRATVHPLPPPATRAAREQAALESFLGG